MELLTPVRKAIFDINKSENAQFDLASKFIQHGNTSVKKHCISVAIVSYWIAKKFKINVDINSLLRGALLHDYFLYDWHEKNAGHGLHGFKHPRFALNNADRDFNLNKVERNVILRHMFPLTPIPPMCKEAWIVCMADKYCSTRETMYTVKRYMRNMLNLLVGKTA